MARIEAKNKAKLANTIWTWVVIGVLGAVVITGIVLGIIYLVSLNDQESEEQTYAEVYEDADLITWEELEETLNPHSTEGLDITGTTYVLVYSPNYEANPKCKEVEEFAKAAVGADNFYILNVLSEDNKKYTLTNSELSGLGKYPVLLVIDTDTVSGNIVIDEKIESIGEINNTLGILK